MQAHTSVPCGGCDSTSPSLRMTQVMIEIEL